MKTDQFLSQREMEYRIKINTIQRELLKWGEHHIKNYPWRITSDPYRITIAEIMLIRTRADQVEKSYLKFIEKFPGFRSLAEADPERIRSELLSLGLSWRADLIYRLAREIVERYDCKLPESFDELVKLPGIGYYTASAILCSIKNIPTNVLDTNTLRIIGRVFGMKVTDSSRRDPEFRKIIHDLMNCGNPRKFLYSTIDFASMVCLPRAPECDICPLKGICNYYGGRGIREKN
ncbi:MAG: DNA glycosylase [Aciduliprofundum sp.]|jgi:A/G-specific adenine glycosylase|nr:MAG: DNA glycosylase [Aciduliprofundum sp.]